MNLETYDDLYNNDKESFDLMENTANALALQFKEPIEYDLTIPKAHDIRRLLYIFQDGCDGRIINPSNVDCIFPNYQNKGRIFEVDFAEKFPKRIKEGLELCFKTKDKYDTYPLEVHFKDKDIFGNE